MSSADRPAVSDATHLQIASLLRGDGTLDGALDGIAAATGFEPLHHVVDLYGRCRQCQTTAGAS